MRFTKSTVRIRSTNGKDNGLTDPVPSLEREGLAVCRSTDFGWSVVHAASGCHTGCGFPTRKAALACAEELLPLTTWTWDMESVKRSIDHYTYANFLRPIIQKHGGHP